jgi:hypothetical protein
LKRMGGQFDQYLADRFVAFFEAVEHLVAEIAQQARFKTSLPFVPSTALSCGLWTRAGRMAVMQCYAISQYTSFITGSQCMGTVTAVLQLSGTVCPGGRRCNSARRLRGRLSSLIPARWELLHIGVVTVA